MNGILSFMSQAFLRWVAVSVTLIHLGALVCVEGDHTDIACDSFRSVPKLWSHDCGPKEIHRPLDASHLCLLCFRHSTSSACLPHIPNLSTAAPVSINRIVASTGSRDEFFTLLAERGPPLL